MEEATYSTNELEFLLCSCSRATSTSCADNCPRKMVAAVKYRP